MRTLRPLVALSALALVAGGGGSGYTEPSASGVFTETAFNSGPGIAEICWPLPTNCKVHLPKFRRAEVKRYPR